MREDLPVFPPARITSPVAGAGGMVGDMRCPDRFIDIYIQGSKHNFFELSLKQTVRDGCAFARSSPEHESFSYHNLPAERWASD